MKRLFGAALVVLLVWPRGYGAVPAPSTVRVLTYNIHHGEGMDGIFDLSRLAAIMEQAQPDLIALQEVDWSTERAGRVNQVAELERLTGMHAAFGKAMNYEGGDYGVAVLSRWPLVNPQNQPLPSFSGREPRTALTVQVQAGENGPLLQFTSTHLDQGRDEDNRLVQAEYLNGMDARDGVPAILAGDMNSRPDTNVIKTLETAWINALPLDPPPTNPPGRPRFRSDYVLFRPVNCWRVIESTLIDERVASDHRPLLAVLEWTGQRSN